MAMSPGTYTKGLLIRLRHKPHEDPAHAAISGKTAGPPSPQGSRNRWVSKICDAVVLIRRMLSQQFIARCFDFDLKTNELLIAVSNSSYYFIWAASHKCFGDDSTGFCFWTKRHCRWD